MAALREEMAALREEVAALLAALTSPGSFLALYGLYPSEAKVPRGIPSPDSSPPRGRLPSEAPVTRGVPSKAHRPPTAQVPRGTTSPDSSPPRGRLPSEAPVARGVPSKPLDRAADLIEPAFDAFTEGAADSESTSELLALAEEHAEVAGFLRRVCPVYLSAQ